MLIEKKYYLLDEVAVRLHCSSSDLIHLGANNNLKIYALANEWLVNFFGVEDSEPGQYPTIVEVARTRKSVAPFQVSGPVRLYPETLLRYEANSAATERRFIATSHDFGDDFDRYEYQLCESDNGHIKNRITISACQLVVMNEDLLALEKANVPDSVISFSGKDIDIEYEEPKSKAPDKFVAALIRLLVEVGKRASEKGVEFDVTAMPGKKDDFHAVADSYDKALQKKSPKTFNTYLKGYCQFKQGATASDFYSELFPEYFT